MRNIWAGFSVTIMLAGCAAAPGAPTADSAPTGPGATNVLAIVHAVRETPPVNANIADDAADDPAIWVAPNPLNSRIIGTQKKGGLYVYDLNGKIVQEAPGGLPNNVDLRDGFKFGDGVGAIIATSDRSDQSIAIWKLKADGVLDTKSRTRIPSGFAEVYGMCVGKVENTYYAVATSKTGDVALWRLLPDANGVKGTLVKKWSLGSISEGCVVDDAAHAFYVSQELVGLWRFNIDTLDAPAIVDRIAPGGNLAADVEGVTIWDGGNGDGFLIVSAQGENRFAVYDRKGGAYRGSFQVQARDGMDGVSGTDGLDVVSAPLGPDFPRGLVVLQDDENTDPVQPQNFKYVSWADIEKGLRLNPPVK